MSDFRIEPADIISAEDLVEVLKDWELEYAQNRGIGGESFAEGYRYELQYAIRRIIEMTGRAYDLSEEGKLEAPESHFYIKSQVSGFVDDLVTCEPADGDESDLRYLVTYYQLKTSPDISWEAGVRPLSLAFRLGKQLLQRLAKDGDLTLLVSTKNAQILTIPKPAGLDDVRVAHVANLRLPDQVALTPHLRATLQRMHFPFVDETSSKNVVTELLGAWFQNESKGYLYEFLDLLRPVEDCRITPPEPLDYPFDDDIRAFLESRFEISMSGAKLVYWSSWPKSSGEMMFNCGTENWEEFEAWIRENSDAGIFTVLAAMHAIEIENPSPKAGN